MRHVALIHPRPFGMFPDIVEYSEVLADNGFSVTYVGLNAPRSTEWTSTGVQVIGLGEGSWPGVKSPIAALRCARRVNALLASMHISLAHIFHFRGAALLPLTSRLRDVAFVLDVRTVHIGAGLRRLRDQLTHAESLAFDGTLVLTEELRRLMKPSWRRIESVPLGVRLTRFRRLNFDDKRREIRAKLGIPDDSVVVLYAGSLHPLREPRLLLEGMKAATDLGSKPYLMILGAESMATKTSPFPESLERCAQSLELRERVRFLGRMAYPEVLDYYAAADIGIAYFPMKPYFDHQPSTKLLEYLACPGMVPIVSPQPGILEQLAERQAAVVYDGSADGLGRTLAELSRQVGTDSFDRMKKSGGPIIEQYAYERMLPERLIPFYTSLSPSVVNGSCGSGEGAVDTEGMRSREARDE